MTPEIIFISGVHGVGKGTFSARISTLLCIPSYSASDLIKTVKKSDIDKNKIVIDAGSNQDYLILALERLNNDKQRILLDGHFCLQGKNSVIDVPIETFNKMKLSSIILLTDDPLEIYKRMYARDSTSLEVEVITALQIKEKERAEYMANYFDVPLIRAYLNQEEEISERLLQELRD